jgi:RNA 2',3'-cyclic 3'-phosphodiesterase
MCRWAEYRWIAGKFQAKGDTMPRLFVAIRPPETVRTALLSLMSDVEAARWQDDEQLHITLRFIGEVDPATADDLAAGLASIASRSLALSVSGVGSFEKRGRVHTLWAGVHPHEPLVTIHRKIGRLMAAIGLSENGLAYIPHITLARFGGQGGQVGRFLARHGDLSLPPFEATEFALYESRLGSEGATYEAAVRYPMR